MAGSENPMEIIKHENYDGNPTLSNLLYGNTDEHKIPLTINAQIQKPDGLKPDEKGVAATEKIKTWERLRKEIPEGFFINETINHMKWYVVNKSKLPPENFETFVWDDTPRTFAAYSLKSLAYPPPLTTDKPYDPSTHVLVKPGENILNGNVPDSVRMLTMLKAIDELGQNTMSKFIMICCVRKEHKFCEESVSTLNFAQSIANPVEYARLKAEKARAETDEAARLLAEDLQKKAAVRQHEREERQARMAANKRRTTRGGMEQVGGTMSVVRHDHVLLVAFGTLACRFVALAFAEWFNGAGGGLGRALLVYACAYVVVMAALIIAGNARRVPLEYFAIHALSVWSLVYMAYLVHLALCTSRRAPRVHRHEESVEEERFRMEWMTGAVWVLTTLMLCFFPHT